MSHNRTKRVIQQAAECLGEAFTTGEESDGPPTGPDRTELARLLLHIDSSVALLRRRLGVSLLVPSNQAPDFTTQCDRALDLASWASALLLNYRPGTETTGASSARNAQKNLQDACANLQRCVMDSVAS